MQEHGGVRHGWFSKGGTRGFRLRKFATCKQGEEAQAEVLMWATRRHRAGQPWQGGDMKVCPLQL